MAEHAPTIRVTEHGPYRVEGDVEIYDADGVLRTTSGIWHLCRCGGSRNKPFCDATHGLKGFDGAETASHDGPADGRESCPGPTPGPTGGCPSAVVASQVRDGLDQVEEQGAPSIRPIVDGPYQVGGVPVTGADGEPYERREQQTLCRCGQSANKPFCDGSHWYAGFRDPLPPELQNVPTLYDWLGGLEALERLTTRFYADILDDPDPLLEPIFRGMDADHPRHVAAWLAETFGGPRRYTEEHGGYEHMVAQHLDRHLTDEQRQRWVARLVATADLVGLPDDPDFRAAFLGYLEWGSRIAVFNSAPGTEIIAHAPVPRWGWGSSAPYVPQVWDAPDAAERGRERHRRESPVTAVPDGPVGRDGPDGPDGEAQR